MQVQNGTSFEVMANPGFDKEGREVVTVIVKASFKILGAGKPQALERDQQIKIVMADEYWGPPGESPIRNESDLAIFKPATDLVLLGAACAPDGLPSRSFEVGLSVGAKSKTRRFSFWSKTERMPLHTIDYKLEEEKWLLAKKPKDGFGFFPRKTSPRRDCAGTYDQDWQKNRFPFLPADFDYHYFQASYPDLRCEPYCRGTEPFQAIGVSVGEPISSVLPGMGIEVEAWIKDQRRKAQANLDTIIVDAEKRLLLLVWRSLFVVAGPPSDVAGFSVKPVPLIQ